MAQANDSDLHVDEPWARPAEAVLDALAVDARRGLDSAEARRRRSIAGPNLLTEQGQPGPLAILARQLTNTMTVVLAVAGVITVAVGDVVDAVVIAVIVALNAVVGFVQEYRAERAMAALKQLSTGTSRAVRDGELADLPTPELVPGDIVEVAAGDVVPADLRLVDAHRLRVNEAPLTGESEPTAKRTETIDGPVAMVGDRHNMAYKGTAITFGRARGVVVATGMATELGQIATLLQRHAVEQTPLQRRLAALGRRMAVGAVVICAVVFAAGLARGEPLEEMFLTAVSLAVAAIPEGLPATVTVALALGARRMAERRAVIRRLPAVETLGSVTVICTDKTGTLTQNRMMVERAWTPTGGLYTVTGDGYAPDGVLTAEGDVVEDSDLQRLARVAAACNDASLHAPVEAGAQWTITGDPTEGALLAFAAKAGIERNDLDRTCPRAAEIAFDAERRRMTTLHRHGDAWWVAVKGALGALRPLLSEADRADLAHATEAADALADDGYRVLALAERSVTELAEPLDGLEHDLRLAGLVAIADPPREEVADAIRACKAAGIAPVMITGDHPRTAAAIARRLGLLDGCEGATMTGADLDDHDDGALRQRIGEVRVFARTNPEQKLRLVEVWKELGAVVAMTGDGVNDAPALRRADIGIAMGVIGTDVSKEASDMVLADDNFATIVHAVEEGRRIYDSIRRFVRYLLTTNSGEILVMFLAPILGLPLPLLPLQILWINLVTDGPPAVALGLEPAEPDTMRRPPRPPTESILAGGLWQHAVWVGVLMAAVVLSLQGAARAAGWPWQTMTFTTLALLQLGHALAVRSERRSLFRLGHRSNRWIGRAVLLSATAQLATVYVPALHEPFGTEALSPLQLAVVLAVSTTAFVAVEIEKAVRRRAAERYPSSMSAAA